MFRNNSGEFKTFETDIPSGPFVETPVPQTNPVVYTATWSLDDAD
jgi:hypothetical protein